MYQTKIDIISIEDSSLTISEKTRGESYEVKVNANGYFFKLNNQIGPRLKAEGNFVGDSLQMRIQLARSQASNSHSIYKGKKIKN